MIRIAKILFPMDFSDGAKQAFPVAIELARKYQAELHLLHVIAFPRDGPLDVAFYVPDEVKVRDLLESTAQKAMDEELKQQKIEGLTIRTECQVANNPGAVILDKADANDFDLIVLGTHGRRGLKRVFLGSVAEQVVRRAACPVLTVCERLERQPPLRIWRRILVPVDFSDHSRQALVHAKSIAASTGARLLLLHVMEPQRHPTYYCSHPKLLEKVDRRHRVLAAESLKRVNDEAKGPDVDVDAYALPGHDVQTIVDFAKDQKSDLIVQASHGRTGLKRFLLGSVAEKVVRHAPCPVLTVKAFGKSLVAETEQRRQQTGTTS